MAFLIIKIKVWLHIPSSVVQKHDKLILHLRWIINYEAKLRSELILKTWINKKKKSKEEFILIQSKAKLSVLCRIELPYITMDI